MLAIEHKFADGQGLYQIWNYDQTSRFDDLSVAANARDVTLNMLDAGGLRSMGSGETGNRGLQTPAIQGMVDHDLQANLQEPMQILADRTGGQAILNLNNTLPALQHLAAEFEVFYSLGYGAPYAGDDEYHSIEVRVKRDRVSVRHRNGYVDRSARAILIERLQASLIHSFEENPLHVDLQVGDAGEEDADRLVVQLDIAVPLASLTLVPTATGLEGQIRVFMVVMDDKGRLSAVVEKPLQIAVPSAVADSESERSWSYSHKMITRQGIQRLGVGVQDELSGIVTYLCRSTETGS